GGSRAPACVLGVAMSRAIAALCAHHSGCRSARTTEHVVQWSHLAWSVLDAENQRGTDDEDDHDENDDHGCLQPARYAGGRLFLSRGVHSVARIALGSHVSSSS